MLGIRLLEVLRHTDWEVHLTWTQPAEKVIQHETSRRPESLGELATRVYSPDDWFAPIASGSVPTHGMVVIPCSMKTLAGIAHGYADNLLLRAADVCLKERRKLVVVPRETPLSLIHIDNMRKVTLAGGIVLPPVLTMYNMPESVEQVVDQIVYKVLNVLGLGIGREVLQRWLATDQSKAES